MAATTVSDMMQAYAQDAVNFARDNFRVDLDFSEQSLRHAEHMLSGLHAALPKGIVAKVFNHGPSQEQIWQMAKMWGAYVGEVIRMRWGGEWSLESQAQPGGVITLHVRGTEIYPPVKVYKRLTHGSEDNLWHYYQVLKSDFARGETQP